LEKGMVRDEKQMEEMVNKATKRKKDPRYIELEAWTGSAHGELTKPALPLAIEKGVWVYSCVRERWCGGGACMCRCVKVDRG
jgi:hypothetical protein